MLLLLFNATSMSSSWTRSFLAQLARILTNSFAFRITATIETKTTSSYVARHHCWSDFLPGNTAVLDQGASTSAPRWRRAPKITDFNVDFVLLKCAVVFLCNANFQVIFFFFFFSHSDVCIIFCPSVRDASICVGPFLQCDSHFLETPSACRFLSCWDTHEASHSALVFSQLVFSKKKKKKLRVTLISASAALVCHWPSSLSAKGEAKKFGSWIEHLDLVSSVSVFLQVRCFLNHRKENFLEPVGLGLWSYSVELQLAALWN